MDATSVLARVCKQLMTVVQCRGGCLMSSSCLRPGLYGVYRNTVPLASLFQFRPFHTSRSKKGLEEFFDDPKNWGEPTVKSGDAWTESQLRTKGSEDLHKLWYVLLKEKNMLLTIEQESKRQRVAMPSPERLEKVNDSLERLDTVIKERETAIRLLQTGQEKARPGDWRQDCFGMVTWYKFSEHPIPWFLNTRYKQTKFFALPYVDHHIRLRKEKYMKISSRKNRAQKEAQQDLEKRFPHLAANAQKPL